MEGSAGVVFGEEGSLSAAKESRRHWLSNCLDMYFFAFMDGSISDFLKDGDKMVPAV